MEDSSRPSRVGSLSTTVRQNTLRLSLESLLQRLWKGRLTAEELSSLCEDTGDDDDVVDGVGGVGDVPLVTDDDVAKKYDDSFDEYLFII